uniref:Uncharacterized protein n=1 Tax=Glossina austeni TaxID=7395 RepID=A0A1A9VI20_GLOAU
MATNANKISGEPAIVEPMKKKHTVLDEIQARCALGKERENRCKDIRPLYEEPQQQLHLFLLTTTSEDASCTNLNMEFIIVKVKVKVADLPPEQKASCSVIQNETAMKSTHNLDKLQV